MWLDCRPRFHISLLQVPCTFRKSFAPIRAVVFPFEHHGIVLVMLEPFYGAGVLENLYQCAYDDPHDYDVP